MKKYRDSQFGEVEILYAHEEDIIHEELVIGKNTENICKLPNGHYVISQKKVFDVSPNNPMYTEYFVKKEWIELISKNEF